MKAVLIKNEQGEVVRWTSLAEHVRYQLAQGIFDHGFFCKVFWGHTLSAQAKWEFAQKQFEKLNTQYPGILREEDLDFYKPQ